MAADLPNMQIVCEGDDNLLNQYGVIAVNQEKYPDEMCIRDRW